MHLWQHVRKRMNYDSPPTLDPASFRTTRWTRVCLAKADSQDGRKALADLCEAYYEPVVAFLRHALHDADAAREMSHAFFTELLGGGRIEGADPTRGRFRSYLLGAVRHFHQRHREAGRRLKRGGGVETFSLDDAEAPDLPDPDQNPPDETFDRQWATTVIARSLAALQAECQSQGRGEFFDSVGGILSGQADHGEQTILASTSGMSPDAFRMAVSRLRKRLRILVKAEVAGTLEDPAEVEEEMKSLFAALGR